MTEITTESAGDGTVPPELSLDPDEHAPYGYTIDRKTGQRRPKQRAGRPKATEEQDTREDQDPRDEVRTLPPVERAADREPGSVTVKGRRKSRIKPPPEDIPAFRAGPIAKGMNRLYLKTGKIVRGYDPEVGQAMIDATKKESDEDVTVGEAWEEVARLNPRIRAFLTKLISGGAWGQLMMVHAPILLAVIMKPGVMRFVPFSKIIESLAEPEEDTPEGEGALPGGMTAADADQVMAEATAHMARLGMDLPPEMMAEAARMAAQMGATRTSRQQPRRSANRAKRK